MKKLGCVNAVPGYITLKDSSGKTVGCTADMPNPIAYAFGNLPNAVVTSEGKTREDYADRIPYETDKHNLHKKYLEHGNKYVGL